MVAHFYRGEKKNLWLSGEVRLYRGIPLWSVAVPPECPPRRLERCAKRLYRKGIRRFLAGDGISVPGPLTAVDPLPLCRAKGAELALTLLPQQAPWERRVALRGGTAGLEARRLALELCPRVGALLLDFDRGEEELARRLRETFGAAALHLGQGQPPQAAVELEPRPFELPRTFRLWGEPELLGYTLLAEGEQPPELPRLPFLELLWETGRVGLEKIRVEKAAVWP